MLPPLQSTSSVIELALPDGFTVIIYVSGVPAHDTPPLVYVGITVIVPLIGAVVVLVATKLGIPVAFPPLDAAKPIAVLLFVQE